MTAPLSGDSPLDSSNRGWVSITKRVGLGKTGRPSCEINWNGNSSANSSPDSLSIPTPNQENRTIIEEEAAEEFLGCTDFTDQNVVSADIYEKAGESASSEWLRTKIVECGKEMGLSVGNNDSYWELLIKFAQEREDQNTEARKKEKIKEESSQRATEFEGAGELR